MNSRWIHEQFANVNMNDTRLQKRAVMIAQGCAERPEKSLSGRFEDWAGLKAAYRFFSNPKVTHQALQQPHYQEVLEKARFSQELVLFIRDGSELLFNSHPWTQGLGPTADCAGNGLMFHSCPVAKYHESKETEILGLSYQEAWVRPEKKPADGPKESEVWLRTLKKSGRPQKNWVSVGGRANDIFDFLHGANSDGWNFVVRARHDRKVEINGIQERFFPWIRRQAAKCKSRLFLRAKGNEFSGEVGLEITWAKAKLLPPGKTSSLAEEEVTYIRVWCPERPKLEWLLITNLPVENEEDAQKIVEIYRRRWL
ncbi:MAG: transposase DNA-binding-containing protein, partial [Waddliaceae bacterium]